jgi:osmoprotectant transport system permease protein
VLDLVILEDDKRYFPPYEALPIFNAASVQKYPKLRSVMGKLAGRISASAMQGLNYEVDGKKRAIKEVVREFLQKTLES